MRVKFSFTLLVLGLSLTGLTTGCRKKVAVAQPAPPPVQEPAPPPAPSLPTASLSAEPASIEAGQAVTLKWSSLNFHAKTPDNVSRPRIPDHGSTHHKIRY